MERILPEPGMARPGRKSGRFRLIKHLLHRRSWGETQAKVVVSVRRLVPVGLLGFSIKNYFLPLALALIDLATGKAIRTDQPHKLSW